MALSDWEMFQKNVVYTDEQGNPMVDGKPAPLVGYKHNPVTGGLGFNGVIVDMAETPDDTNTAAYPVGTLFISPEA